MGYKKPAKIYTKVPKTAPGSGCFVTCTKCGTNEEYSLEDMQLHKFWCGLAKEAADKAQTHKKKRQSRAPTRR